jgi:hypothetical protein
MNSVLVRVSLSLAQMRVGDPSEFKERNRSSAALKPMVHWDIGWQDVLDSMFWSWREEIM